ncbi:ComEA family DNA-binding protein [Salegentibacter sp. HM20]
MKPIKSHFVFSRKQQNGIFVLVGIIILLQAFYFLSGNRPSGKAEEIQNAEILAFQKKLDSIKAQDIAADTVKIYPFNPNFLTDYRGYVLGMSPEEIDRLLKFRAGNQWINSAIEFQQVTGISDSLLASISPYFRFPEFVNNRNTYSENAKPRTNSKSSGDRKDLNLAEARELQQISGIGEVLATRIINYRNKIGGFRDMLQLKDVYGLNFELREKIAEEFKVELSGFPGLISINRAGVLELAELPYFDYELAREIVDYRALREGIQDFEELSKIDGFPYDKIDQIRLYLTID